MQVSELAQISADAHVNEPHDLWYNRMTPRLRDLAPHHIQDRPDGGWTMVVNGDQDCESARQKQVWTEAEDALSNEREAAASASVRLEMMATDGINGEIIHPTIGLYIYRMTDPAAGTEACRVYNDWIYEHLGEASPRIKLSALLPVWNVDDAIAEVGKLAPLGSVGGLMLPIVGTPHWNDSQWEPLWSAIEETGKPVVMHQSTGHTFPFRGLGAVTANMLHMQSMAPWATALLACSGVLERHPNLHFVLVETNGGWLAWAMSMLDEWYEGITAGSMQVNPRANYKRKPEAKELPSFYIARQMHSTFQNDALAIRNRDLTGVDALLWGNDYPHAEGTYPESQRVLSHMLNDIPRDEAERIVGKTAARLFGFDQSVLDSRPDPLLR